MFSNSYLFLLIGTCLMYCYVLSGQSSETYFSKDFLYKYEAYRIEAEHKDNRHNFKLSLDSQVQEFDMISVVNPDDQYIFYRKLATAISKVQSAAQLNFLNKSNNLNDTLTAILQQVDEDTAFVLTDARKLALAGNVTELAKVKGCDSVFQNRTQFTSLLDTANNVAVATFFQSLKNACQYPAGLVNEADDQELLKVSMNLFNEILRYSLIDPDDASLAGRLVVLKDTIAVCVEVEKEKGTRSKGGSSAQNEVINSPAKITPTPDENEQKKTEAEPASDVLVEFGKSDDDNRTLLDDTDGLPTNRALANEMDEIRAGTKWWLDKIKEAGCGDSINLLIIDSVQFEFEADKLQNVKVVGQLNGQPEIFENVYPVSFSTKRDGNENHRLFSVRDVDNKRRVTSSKNVFYFDYNLLLYTENYAPKDQVLYVKPGESGTVLLKEPNSEILKAKVFTDLVGLNDDDPNGLLQLEFSKPIYLRTKVRPLDTFSRAYRSVFSQIEPIFTIAKIEDDDNELEVLQLGDNAFVSYNDVVRYRRASIGANVTIYSLGLPSWHSTIDFKYSHHYSVVSIANRDSTNQVSLVTGTPDSVTLVNRVVNGHLARELGPSVVWTILPSDKYQLSLTYTMNRFRFYSNDEDRTIIPYADRLALQAAPQEVAMENQDKAKTYHTFELLATVRLSKRGELFFRSRYHFLNNNPNQNFFQSQLGYSYFFFAANN